MRATGDIMGEGKKERKREREIVCLFVFVRVFSGILHVNLYGR